MYVQNLRLQTAALRWKPLPLTEAQLTLQTHSQVHPIMSRMQPSPRSDKPQVSLWFASSIPFLRLSTKHKHPYSFTNLHAGSLWLRLRAARPAFPGETPKTRHYRIHAPGLHHSPARQANPAPCSDFIQTRHPMLSMIPTPPPELTEPQPSGPQ